MTFVSNRFGSIIINFMLNILEILKNPSIRKVASENVPQDMGEGNPLKDFTDL